MLDETTNVHEAARSQSAERSKPTRIALTDPFIKALPQKLKAAQDAHADTFQLSASKGVTIDVDVPPIDKNSWLTIVDVTQPALQLRLTNRGVITFFCRYRVGNEQRRRNLGRYGRGVTLADARTKAGAIVQALGNGIDPDRVTTPIVTRVHTVKEVAELYFEKYLKAHNLRSADEWEQMLRRELLRDHGQRPIGAVTERDILDVLEAVRERGRERAKLGVLQFAAVDEREAAEREHRQPNVAAAQAAAHDTAEKAALKAGTSSNRVLGEIRKFFKWAIKQKYLKENPAGGIEKLVRETSGERVLSDAELRAIWYIAPQLHPVYGDIVRSLILSACRLTEISEMAWPEYNRQTGDLTLSEDRNKSKRVFVVPLPDLARAIIEGRDEIDGCPYVFSTDGTNPASGVSNWKSQLDELLRMERAKLKPTERANFFAKPWVHHDLRRTVDTGMARLEVAPHVIEAVLNHAIRGVAGRYNRYDYHREKKAALARWAEHVARIIAPPGSNVVDLHHQATG